MICRLVVAATALLLAGLAPAAGAGAVAGGWLVPWATHPWVASVGDEICGGVLVAPDRVATSSRCADHTYVPEKIRIGNERRTVVAVAMHPGWVRQRLDPASRCGDMNVLCTPDIALLRLDRPVRGVAIPRLSVARTRQRAVVIGHGTTAIDDDQSNPARLRAALLEVRPDAVCRRYYTTAGDLARMQASTTLCTTDPRPPRNAGICVGDGGAPLVDGRRLFGIGSWNHGCGESGEPSIFTAVAPYRGFLLSHAREWQPMAQGIPMLAGAGAVGAVLTCTPPPFTNRPDRLIFLFRTRAGPRMRQRGPDATYVVRDEDRGQAITCDVFAVNGGGYARANAYTSVEVTDSGSLP